MVKTRRIYIAQQFICSLFIILFVYTGLNKLMDHETFLSQLHKSPFMQWGPGFVSYAIPVGELLLALGLIIRKTRMIALMGSFFLMAMFTGYIWIMLTYANDLPCSCGGILAAMTWEVHLVFNAVFTLLAALAIWMESILKKGKSTANTEYTKQPI
ncbi:MauE/DoxX family redox-associated membrane protein [Chitinophaga rhizosphaerae]|uniref:MauE/DoxX family redox-associated membrane protein n=1 Tax=Chitinophaga rhizosphaerae TaxID=1864947 RepID=UPI000F7FD63B|nr:MauE/DoxX family redox-associated membrane protein [Chitinophaga rhizosphaerae]